MLLLIFPTCQKMWYYIDIFFRLAVWSIVVMCPWIKPRYCIVESHLFAKQAQRVSRLWQCHLRLSTAFVSVPTDCQSMDLICLLVEGIWQSLPVAAQGMRLYWVWFLVRPRAVPCGDPPYSIMAGNIMWVILIDELDSHQFVIISKYCIVFFDSLFLSISVFPHWLDNCCTFGLTHTVLPCGLHGLPLTWLTGCWILLWRFLLCDKTSRGVSCHPHYKVVRNIRQGWK